MSTLDRVRLRLRVVRECSWLDSALADGADPNADPALALRAEKLTGLPTRRALAATLHNLVDAADEPPEGWSHNGCRPPLQREAVLEARSKLLSLAAQLRQDRHVSPRSAALTALLIWDAGSPVYAAQADATVAQWADAVLDNLSDSRSSPSGR